MNKTRALEELAALGFKGQDVYFAELIPAVEMAWADGVVQPDERAMLESYCFELTRILNTHARAQAFSPRRALALLQRLLTRRLDARARYAALQALCALWGRRSVEARERMLGWAQAVAVAGVDGSPVWDTRELFWLQRMEQNLVAA
jgi:tellurite resistance protein